MKFPLTSLMIPEVEVPPIQQQQQGSSIKDLKTMDLDNPSYFSIAAESSNARRKMGNADSLILNRQFLRSISSNSADSNPELLIMGEPRLCDIAPDLAFKHPASRSNSLNSKTTSKCNNDVIYQALPTSDELASSGDEVFISETNARYCNYNNRRHSIGTFNVVGGGSRERAGSATSRSLQEDVEFPQAIVHADSEGEVKRKTFRLPASRGAIKRTSTMDDILIVSLKSSETAALWVEYFASYFDQISKQANRKPFKIQYVSAEDCLEERQISVEKTANVKLQLIVLCPGFLEFIVQYADKCGHLGRIFSADRTLALLLGVADIDITEAHRQILPTYFQWQRLSVGQDQDENFTKEFLGQAMAILSRVWKQQSSLTHQDKATFSVSPKKIRQGQSSVFILLTSPLQREDSLKVSIERHNELFEVKSVKRRNPYTVKITVPDNLTEITAIVNIYVEKNGSIIGSRPIKCESRLRELEQILRLTNNPIEFMCQTMGFSPTNKEQLDNWLVQAFRRNLPAHFNLLANHHTPFAAAIHVHKHSHEEFPTLLHFAAKFGFEKLALELLDCPGADVAYEVRNVYDMTPADIAEAHGHPDLATTLKGYMNMNEFTSMYAKLKEMSLNTGKSQNSDEDSYLTPKTFDDLYKICPAPRPILQSRHSPVATPTSPMSTTPSGYLTMNIPVKATIEREDSLEETIISTPPPDNSPVQSKNPEVIGEDKVQKELLEIINDFKNNVHSIAQVEKLVEEWKNRNDVQKSFKEKQEQLHEMRVRYERIQVEMKAAMKKSTPFERVKKLFARGKSREDKQEISAPMLSPSIVAIQSQRPVSSLSTSSSGSSGRMSTISGCSLGDSGTHSDNDERKNMLGSHSEDDFRNVLNKAVLELNYTPVPVPKPVKNGMFSHKNKFFETIEEKPVPRPDTLPLCEEYYIQFPPSGLPVPVVASQKTPIDQEYMNVSATGTSNDVPSTENHQHEYMNFKVMTTNR